jgi:hypothetical protein
MALTIMDPRVLEVALTWAWKDYYEGGTSYDTIISIDLSRVTDAASDAPVFDTQHEVFTNPIVDQASQNAIGDNSNGLQDPLRLEPTLTYTYTTGYSTEHQTSKAVTTTVTQSFDYEFLGVGGSTKLSASGTFSWTDSTRTDKTTSVSNSLAAPFEVPKGRIYEEKLLFEQQQVSVPYALLLHLDDLSGQQSNISFVTQDFGARTLGTPGLIYAVNQGGRAPLPVFEDLDWANFYGQGPYIGDTRATYALHGTLTVQGASTGTVKIYDITNGASQRVQAEYEAEVAVGVRRTMDDKGRSFRDTPFDDWVDGGAGNDRMRLRGGEDIVHAGSGHDRITATGVGRSLLDGGEGNDVIRLFSEAAYGTVLGGSGHDRIVVDAPAAMIYGGAGNDRYTLNAKTAGGTVITDTEGRNRLDFGDHGGPVGFERVPHGDNLYILLGGDTYDRARDVVWVDFFSNPNNTVNGLRTAEVAELATTFRMAFPPLATETPTTAQFINAADWVYGRDADNYPVDLRPFEVDGRHMALEVTQTGFYGAAFLTPSDQVIVAFEGTNLSALQEDPVFVAAQVAADAQIYLGLKPAAYDDALDFTRVVLDAAASQGIGAEDVFVSGHSLGAAQAQYVAAQLGLAGETFAGPGIPASAIPAGATSRLVNYVEYGDPLGNYSATPAPAPDYLFSDDILRFGKPTFIGNPLAGIALRAAGSLLGPGSTDEEMLEGVLALAALAREYHVLTRYASDLGVLLDSGQASPGSSHADGLLFA